MCRTKIFLVMILNEIKCHVNTSLGLVGGCILCIPPCVRAWLQLPVTIKRCFLKVAINDKNCSSDIRSFDSFRNKFFAKVISHFKSFSLSQYDL